MQDFVQLYQLASAQSVPPLKALTDTQSACPTPKFFSCVAWARYRQEATSGVWNLFLLRISCSPLAVASFHTRWRFNILKMSKIELIFWKSFSFKNTGLEEHIQCCHVFISSIWTRFSSFFFPKFPLNLITFRQNHPITCSWHQKTNYESTNPVVTSFCYRSPILIEIRR